MLPAARSGSCLDVLIVEDNDDLRDLIAENLRELGHEPVPARDRASAMRTIGERPIDVLLTDVALPDGSGIALASATAGADDGDQAADTVFELRQYTLHPGQRDILVDVFDDNFIEGQEADGMRIIGQNRDLDDPDRFVWLRSFRDMEARKVALTQFYSGPVWKAHGRVAAGTMVDAGNVLLLRPFRPDTTFALPTVKLPPPGTRGPGKHEERGKGEERDADASILRRPLHGGCIYRTT